MVMMAQDDKLNSLIGQFDIWFKDLALEAYIDKFDLDSDQDTISDQIQKDDERAKKKDRIKLGVITRTTTSWFKPLARPMITDHDMDISDADMAAITRAEEEDSQLDNFAKDLEQLLDDAIDEDSGNSSMREDEDKETTNGIHYFSNYTSDELALADPDIGLCCTISTSASISPRMTQAITVFQSSLRSIYQNDLKRDNEQPPEANHQNQTPMPRDHEYLARPLQKPLIMCYRTSHREKDAKILQLMAQARKHQKLASVLNTGIIKRFARFSEKVRLLSCEQ